jgi:large subunit ribosomal protein L5
MAEDKKKKGEEKVNVHAVPKISKVVVNVGVGKNRDDSNYKEAVINDLMAITGQRPHERRARKSVAGFNVRQGNVIGYRVTLRGKRRDDFIARFIGMALPRVRDFRGIKLTSFDGSGNLNIGIEEQLAFPEIRADKTEVVFGVQVTLVTTAEDNDQGEALFREMGFPLEEKQ